MRVYTPDDTRLFFEEQSEEWTDAEVVFSRTEDGRIRIAVGDEKDVGSYNDWFACSIVLSSDQTQQLFMWLVKNFRMQTVR